MKATPPCMTCIHYRDLGCCDAYPNGIPQVILHGRDHDTPRGDEVRGIVWELDPAKAETETVRRKLMDHIAAEHAKRIAAP